jgi:hypothetical protein
MTKPELEAMLREALERGDRLVDFVEWGLEGEPGQLDSVNEDKAWKKFARHTRAALGDIGPTDDD